MRLWGVGERHGRVNHRSCGAVRQGRREWFDPRLERAKALALGATAVGVGRPYIYALVVGGADGLVSQLRSMLAELDLLMAVDGYPSVADLRTAGARRI